MENSERPDLRSRKEVAVGWVLFQTCLIHPKSKIRKTELLSSILTAQQNRAQNFLEAYKNSQNPVR